jgi:hypothetical protein
MAMTVVSGESNFLENSFNIFRFGLLSARIAVHSHLAKLGDERGNQLEDCFISFFFFR